MKHKMLDSLGTFQNAGLSKEEVKSALTGKCSIGSVSTVEEIEDGVNASAVLTTDTGDKYFLKCNTFMASHELFYAQPFILSYFNKSNSTIRTPQIVGYDYTRSEIPYEWYMTEYIAGETIETESDDVSIETYETVGTILGNINSISVDGCGYPSQERETEVACRDEIDNSLPFVADESSWEDHLKEEMYEFVRTADSRFGGLRERIREFIDSQSVREVSPQLTHFDYWWQNILWEDETPYVIDWERAVGGDPVANRVLSEHYMFDRVAMEQESLSGDEYASDNRKAMEAFRDAYEASYTGEQSLQTDAETQQMYHLLLYLRELRGFPYWWRNKSAEWTEKRAEALRNGVKEIISDST